ncbi:EthD domain-containing protein [Solimonas terrae]|uniref:Uncharacterized protein n=1 Tax=Solimonas terrae TaxID=1396819 RepID=A0A6M2BSW3_9GAMM|nr:EthD domain-containing protein [Solimonas terrae]NGY05732.1 hypothetical protein [Solimonas terrae]
MEKIIYLLWRDPQQDRAAHAAQLREQLAPALQRAGARSVRLNLDDADVGAAAGLRQKAFNVQPDAFAQVWVDSAIGFLRQDIDAAIRANVASYAGYLVTESAAIVNRAHPPTPGLRTYGFAQMAILRRPARLSHAQWLDVWHNTHTIVGIETQSNFEYIQNVVVQPLRDRAPALEAFVEECFPPEAMNDPYVFFDAVGDEAKFKRNLDRMMESVHRFIDMDSIDVLPTSQYQMF